MLFHACRVRSSPNNAVAICRWDAPSLRASWTRRRVRDLWALGSSGNRLVGNRRRTIKLIARLSDMICAMPARDPSIEKVRTKRPLKLPPSRSIRMRRSPSDRTMCSPSSSNVLEHQGRKSSADMPSGSPSAVRRAVARRTAGSRQARQMIRASRAARSGFSAKVQPPDSWVVAFAARARRGACVKPSPVSGIAAKPFPHQSRSIDSYQPVIGICITPN